MASKSMSINFEQKAFIKICSRLGESPLVIHEKLKKVYIEDAYSLSTVNSDLSDELKKVSIHSRKRKYEKQYGARKRHPTKKNVIKRVAIPERCPSEVIPTEESLSDHDVSSQIAELPPSTNAAHKIGTFSKINSKEEYNLTCNAPNSNEKIVKGTKVCSNIVVNASILESVLEYCAICKSCFKGNLKVWNLGGQSCIANHLTLRCEYCGCSKDFWTLSGKFNNKIEVGSATISRRNDSVYQSVLAAILIGTGKTGLDIYHSMIGIPNYPSGLDMIHKDLLIVAEYIANQSMTTAATELKQTQMIGEDNLIHDKASFDGAYQKRSSKGGGGFSRYCFASLISMTNGKVLAYDIACNSCSKCTYLEGLLENSFINMDEYDEKINQHLDNCSAKYRDFSSVSLESELAPLVIKHALGRGIIIDGLTCDGDNKTFSKLAVSNPYAEVAPLHQILRYECLSHVGKRMKTHLIEHQKDVIRSSRASKKITKEILLIQGTDTETATKQVDKQYGGTLSRTNIPRNSWGIDLETSSLISKSKNLSKKKRTIGPIEIKFLSDEMCSRITSFYQLAVKQNIGNPQEILRAIKAIPLHLGANNSNAVTNHALCTKGLNSWCRYQRAIAEGVDPPQHPNFLSEVCIELVKKVFHQYNYDKEYFVDQVSLGSTSNNNEALHNILFSMVKKTSAVGIDIMKLSSALAVIRFNEGYSGILKILEILQVKIHSYVIDTFTNLDKARVEQSYRIAQKQLVRYKSRIHRHSKNSASIRKFGKGYESGKSSASFNHPNSDLAETSLENVCVVCNMNENTGIVDNLNIIVEDTFLNLMECISCKLCYHRICLDLNEIDFVEENWLCPACND